MKAKKAATPMSFRLDSGVVKKLRQFCDETGSSQTNAVENILKKFLDEYFEKPKSQRSNFS